ncbi:DUF305 domain-containing protein [Actinotalea ferrariae]|uniref:DUF305 domain-containing protein n=1 Tax=Actinotalea ferrariae TaxID=1386098 RepID=UPI001C8B7BE4|nr:DUF305 domain-containing protein [Actinotalea ferrariae]MBX9246091.1 DUF305 domain-containing protein [Actinotalea ferrariae]
MTTQDPDVAFPDGREPGAPEARPDGDAPPLTPGRAGPRAVLVAVAVVALAAGAAIGLLVGGSVLRPAVPVEGSVDVGFARDMARHHEQAVEMSVLVRDRSDDADVRLLALDIETTQQHQAGQMFGWLAGWGLPATSSAPPMAWAGDAHGHGGGGHVEGDEHPAGMPGLATTEQMERLAAADGEEADRIYLALMIPHHVGGVEMAEAAVDAAGQPHVRRLAEAIIASQEAELTLLEQMLEERGGPPADL